MTITQQFWDRLVANSLQGTVSFTHNVYLKMFAMEVAANNVQLRNASGRSYDVILIDEAQDMNGVTSQILLSQECTRVLVGDK